MATPKEKMIVKIIHLERSRERQDHIETVLLPNLLAGKGEKTRVETFQAIDGLKAGVNGKYLEKFGIEWKKKSMWPTQVAAFLSHFAVWTDLLISEDGEYYLVLEDDTQVSEKYLETFWPHMEALLSEVQETDPLWKWVYLWVNPDCDKGTGPRIEGKSHIRPAVKTYGAVAYLVSKEGARFLTGYFQKNGLTNTVDDTIMYQIVNSGNSGFFTSIHRLIDTVGPIYGHQTTEKLASTVCLK